MLQSFFGLGQSADIDIVLADQETRKSAEIKAEDGKKKRHFLFYDGESVSGKVRSQMRKMARRSVTSSFMMESQSLAR